MSKVCLVDIHGIGYTAAFKVTIRAPGGIPVSSCLCTIYHNGKARVMWIDNVETTEQYRGRGWATRLMKEVLLLATELKIDSIELITNGDNLAAQRLYDGSGMERTGKQHWRRILNKWPI